MKYRFHQNKIIKLKIRLMFKNYSKKKSWIKILKELMFRRIYNRNHHLSNKWNNFAILYENNTTRKYTIKIGLHNLCITCNKLLPIIHISVFKILFSC